MEILITVCLFYKGVEGMEQNDPYNMTCIESGTREMSDKAAHTILVIVLVVFLLKYKFTFIIGTCRLHYVQPLLKYVLNLEPIM